MAITTLEQRKNSLRSGHRTFSDKNWLKFNLTIAREVSLHSSIFFGYLVNVESYMVSHYSKKFYKNDMWFFSKLDHAEEKLNMTKHIQRKCIEELEQSNLIETKLGKNKFRWYRINWNDLQNILNNWEQSNPIHSKEDMGIEENEDDLYM